MNDTADLPADVGAFVATIEQYVAKGDGGADEIDTRKLCGIIRKQAAELAIAHKANLSSADTIEQFVAPWRTANVQLTAERDKLRKRLAKLESATRDALNVLGPEYFDDGKPFEELGRLVNIKGES